MNAPNKLITVFYHFQDLCFQEKRAMLKTYKPPVDDNTWMFVTRIFITFDLRVYVPHIYNT